MAEVEIGTIKSPKGKQFRVLWAGPGTKVTAKDYGFVSASLDCGRANSTQDAIWKAEAKVANL